MFASLLFAALAQADPPAPPAAPPTEDTCNEYLSPPPGWKVHVQEATGQDALGVARRDAREALFQQLCGPRSRFGRNRCARIREQITDWKGRVVRRGGRKAACATAAIPEQFLWELDEEDRVLTAGLERLARDVLDLLPADRPTVQPVSPHWATGCSARDLGEGLLQRLLSRMAAASDGLGIVPQNVYERDVATLALAVLPSARGELMVTARLHLPGETAPRVLEGVRFADDLFDYQPGDEAACVPDTGAGPAGPLRPRVRVMAGGGQACEGAWIEPVVEVARPARIQVFSVSHGGTAYRIWPPPGQDGVVADSQSLGPAQLVLLDGYPDSRLVRGRGGPRRSRVPGVGDLVGVLQGARRLRRVGARARRVERGARLRPAHYGALPDGSEVCRRPGRLATGQRSVGGGAGGGAVVWRRPLRAHDPLAAAHLRLGRSGGSMMSTRFMFFVSAMALLSCSGWSDDGIAPTDSDGDGVEDGDDCAPEDTDDAGRISECACPDLPATPAGCLEEREGDDPGECSDGADNDWDGLYDCDDPDCAGAPACQGDDDDLGDDDDDVGPGLVGLLREETVAVRVGTTVLGASDGTLDCSTLDDALAADRTSLVVALDGDDQVVAIRLHPEVVDGCDVDLASTARALPVLVAGGLAIDPTEARQCVDVCAQLDLTELIAALESAPTLGAAMELPATLAAMADVLESLEEHGIADPDSSREVVDGFTRVEVVLDPVAPDSSALLTGTATYSGYQQEYVGVTFASAYEQTVWLKHDGLDNDFLSDLFYPVTADAQESVSFSVPLGALTVEDPTQLYLTVNRPGAFDFSQMPPTLEELVVNMRSNEATFAVGLWIGVQMLIPDFALGLDDFLGVDDIECVDSLVEAFEGAVVTVMTDDWQALADADTLAEVQALVDQFVAAFLTSGFAEPDGDPGWLVTCFGADEAVAGQVAEYLGFLNALIEFGEAALDLWTLGNIAYAAAWGPTWEIDSVDLCELAGCDECVVQDGGVVCGPFVEPCTDTDGDGYGAPGSPSCDEPEEDCNDADASINPGAAEVCDSIDQDCVAGNEPTSTWYRDDDSDGYGTSDSVAACSAASPYTASNSLDCNDGDPLAWTGAAEVCGDGSDNDCVGGDDVCPWIEVTGPTGTLIQDAPYTATWNSGGIAGNVRVHAYEGGVHYATLAADTPDTGSLPFTPPSSWPTGSDWQICVSDLANTADDCGDFFTLDAPAPSVTITSPASSPWPVSTATLTASGTFANATSVLWSLSSGGSGACGLGTGTFSCLVSGLVVGTQTLTVTALGSGSAQDTITVEYTPAVSVVYSQDFSSTAVFSEAVVGNQTFSDLAEWWDAGLFSWLTYGSGYSGGTGQSMNIHKPSASSWTGALRLIIPASATPGESVIVDLWTMCALSSGTTPIDFVRAGGPTVTVDVPCTNNWEPVTATVTSTLTTSDVIIYFGAIPDNGSSWAYRVDEIEVSIQ